MMVRSRTLAGIAAFIAALAAPSACSDSVSPSPATIVPTTAPSSDYRWSYGWNKPPVASIATPVNYASFVQASSVLLSGSGNDPETGALTGASLVWKSSRDGLLGTGTSLTITTLSVGTHTITLTATDPKGATGSASRSITVTTATTTTATTNQPPVAQFTVSCVALVCTADASASTDDVGITKAVWNWGNGQSATATAAITSYTYAAAGTFLITLTVTDGGGLTGTMSKSVTVVSGTTAPAPAPAPTGANEPSGMTLLTERPFNCSNTTICETDWWTSGNLTIVQDASAPKSASNVGQFTYPAGFVGGSGPGTEEFDFSAQKATLYVSTWIRFDPNWQGHETGINKLLHFFINGLNRVVISAEGSGSNPLLPTWRLQGLAAPYFDGVSQTSTDVNLRPNVDATIRIIRGVWQRYEAVLIANTPGVADGSLQLWIDGAKVLNYAGIMFADAGGNSKWKT